MSLLELILPIFAVIFLGFFSGKSLGYRQAQVGALVQGSFRMLSTLISMVSVPAWIWMIGL